MKRCIVLSVLFCAILSAGAGLAPSFFNGRQLSPADAVKLEAALAADAEDLDKRAQLLGFYVAQQANDPDWTNRMRLLSWTVEHYPASEILTFPGIWIGIPFPMFRQVQPMFVSAIHQHVEDPTVLRNAATFLTANASRTAPASIRVGGNVSAVNLISQVNPVYPPLAREARIQGTVKFEVVIGLDGHVESVQLISGHPLLIEVANDAVKQWFYKPTLLNGSPVKVTTTVDVNFTLPQ